VSYGASGVFATQLANEAPYDVFLSADVKSPRALADAGLTEGPAFVYAVGKLVLWVPNALGPLLDSRGLEVVREAQVTKVAIANPAVAPYGTAAEQALEASRLTAAVKPRLVLGQNVGQAAQFASSGNVQAAFLPLSLAAAPPLSTEGRCIPVPASLHAPIEQAGVVLKRSKAPALAKAFVALLLGAQGRAILEKSGYGLPAAK
jgi:molybdate transport system substrate-binding protein